MTPFAAGCAICGADLETWRRERTARRESKRIPRPQLPSGIAGGRSGEILFGVAMAVLALFAPPLGVLLCGYMAYRFDREGNTLMRNVAAGCALAALVFTLFPVGVYAKVLDAIY